MLSLENRIDAFAELGRKLRLLREKSFEPADKNLYKLNKLIEESHIDNPWFTEENVKNAIHSIGLSLEEEKIGKWLSNYDLDKIKERKRVGVVMAGNIPMVGFHDFLCVLISGHKFLGKLSSDDKKLLPAVAELLLEIEPEFDDSIKFTEDKLTGFDAIIATGSNNTSRYFEYYFGKYPHIIRKNRNGVAVFTGDETSDELTEFGKDLFQYFGMGCRSVSKVFVPKGYKFNRLFEALSTYNSIIDHHKYTNNYDYYKSIYLINKTKHFDNGFLLVKQDLAYASPPSVLYFEEYDDMNVLKKRLIEEGEQIQCIVSHAKEIDEAIPFGKAQKPKLWDYADGVDMMEFLLSL